MDSLENIPLPEELAAEEESPYRRRQKVVVVSRRGPRAVMRWIVPRVLLAAFVILPLGYAAYRLAVFALTSPAFALNPDEDLVVTGNRFVTREEIVSVLEGPPLSGGLRSSSWADGQNGTLQGSDNIFRLSLDQKRRQVESIPWVLSATVARVYPRHLEVNVVERAPVAFVNVGGHIKLVDSEGIVLEKPEKGIFDFAVLAGLDSVAKRADRKARIALFQEFSRQWSGERLQCGWLVSEVDLGDPDDLKALLIQGRETILVHFGHRDFAARFHTFLTLLPEVRKTTPRIDSVDLRYRGQLVVNPEGERPVITGQPKAPESGVQGQAPGAQNPPPTTLNTGLAARD